MYSLECLHIGKEERFHIDDLGVHLEKLGKGALNEGNNTITKLSEVDGPSHRKTTETIDATQSLIFETIHKNGKPLAGPIERKEKVNDDNQE